MVGKEVLSVADGQPGDARAEPDQGDVAGLALGGRSSGKRIQAQRDG